MKTKLTLICFLFLLAFSVNASPVDIQEASDVAASFLKQSSVKEVAVPFEHLYVFNGDHCFVIVPDDDVVTPIIGYSHDRCFDAASMNDNLKGWLMQIDENIQACKDAGKQATDKVRGQWDFVRKGLGLPVVNRSVVEPLVKTKWDQGNPFNGSCPGGSVTGCSATAMAQVMKYWEFPNHGIGSHSYVHPDYGTLSADFSAATYDWDHMPLRPLPATVSDVERQALSTLMYHCGVSIDMNYGLDESSGDMTKMVSSMPEYFGYAPTIEWKYQRNYSDADWKLLLKAELNASRPMCYASGFPRKNNRYSFHAFVCDGYDEFDYFHFNWGWGGSGDGYYAVNPMYPVGETNINYVVKGISPIFKIAAPTNLTATPMQGQVQLSWSQPQGAVSCNVYRDDELIATGVTANSYCDTVMSFGLHSYYLKAIDGYGNRSWKSNSVQVFHEFTAPAPTALGATVSGNQLTLHWDMPSAMNDTLAYGTGPCVGSYGYSPTYPNPTFWGQRYPAEMLMPYGGYDIKGVSLYVTKEGSYTLNICRGNGTGVTEVMTQQTFDVVEVNRWCDMVLDTLYPLEFTDDVWIVMNTPGGMYYVMTVCEYDGPGLEDAAYYSTEMSDLFYLHGMGHSWMMKVMLEDGLTYRVTRNGSLVATGLHGRTFVDHDIASGDWTYTVWSAYQGVECDEPVSYSISLTRVDVVASDMVAGTIQGTGLYEVGTMAAVTALPNEGYAFAAWLEDGVEVSTDNPYSFCVEDSRYLVAQFKGTGVDEDDVKVSIAPNPVKDELYVESSALIRRIEITMVNGMMVENKKVDNYSVNCHLGDCAEGVYFLRLFTDEGVITKKIVVSE